MKILIRQRIAWAARATRWLSPTRDIAPSAVAAIATFVVTWATAPIGTRFDWRVAGFPLLAGVMAFAATYLVINLAEFLTNCWKASRILRIEGDQRQQMALIATSMDTTIKNWLRKELSKPEFRVRLAGAFGSVIAAYPTRDVDVVVQLQAMSDRRARKSGLRLKGLSRTFEHEFRVALHVQLFLSTETDALMRFATRAGALELLLGEEYWAEISVPSTSTSSDSG